MEIKFLVDYPEHVEMVSNWIYKEFIEGIRAGISYELILKSCGARNKDSLPISLIALKNNICVGTISLFENDLKERRDLSPWLGALYVDKEFRNQGIAKQLIDRIIEIAKEMKKDKIYLRTEHASEYYKKLGWIFVLKTIDGFNLNTEVYMKEI